MTWARNVFFLATAFLMGRSSVLDGWHRFAVDQAAVALIASAIIAIWVGLTRAERAVKGRPDAAINISDPAGRATRVKVRYCPHCGQLLSARAFDHVATCVGGAA